MLETFYNKSTIVLPPRPHSHHSPPTLPSPPTLCWYQAKLCSATNAISACGTCASPRKPRAKAANTATVVSGKQVRSSEARKYHCTTFSDRPSRRMYAPTPPAAYVNYVLQLWTVTLYTSTSGLRTTEEKIIKNLALKTVKISCQLIFHLFLSVNKNLMKE